MKQGIVKDPNGKGSALPRNHRDFQKLDYTCLTSNTTGLNKLKCIASGQYTPAQFLKAIEEYEASHVFVFDCRKESHFFLDDRSYCWFKIENAANADKNKSQVIHDEISKAQVLSSFQKAVVYKERDLCKTSEAAINTKTICFERALTEREFIEQSGAHYHRFPTLDHHRPSDEMVQEFLHVFAMLPANAILYFHCRGGMGRATTFLVLVDIMINPDVPLEDILNRHFEVGHKDLLGMAQYVGKRSGRLEAAQQRLAFIKNFHDYVISGKRIKMSWLDYVDSKKLHCATQGLEGPAILGQFQLNSISLETCPSPSDKSSKDNERRLGYR